MVQVNQPVDGTVPANPGTPAGTVPNYGVSPGPNPPPLLPSGTPPANISGAWTPPPSSSAPPVTPAPVMPQAASGAAPPSYGGTPLAAPGPAATFNGSILPPANYDPQATPGCASPTLLPQDPYLQPPGTQWAPFEPVVTMQKFFQEIRGDYTWMGSNGSANRLDVQDLTLTATFAFPFLYSTEHPLLITPGFGYHLFNPPAGSPTFNTCDAFLDAEWNPQFTPWLGAELGGRIGVYSDFKKVHSEAIRLPSHAFAVLKLQPTLDLKFGIIYLDRVRISELPGGGLVWQPNADNRFDILFPNPKIAHRLGTDGITDWWLYGRGDYGGGSWEITPPGSSTERVDYNDVRVAVGLEFHRHAGLSGLFEVGYAFDREVYSLTTDLRPSDAWFLRAALSY